MASVFLINSSQTYFLTFLSTTTLNFLKLKGTDNFSKSNLPISYFKLAKSAFSVNCELPTPVHFLLRFCCIVRQI